MEEDDQRELLEIYQQIDNAMVSKNTEALEIIIDTNYILEHMGGYKQSKQEWLEQIKNEKMRYIKTMPQKASFKIKGNRATLTCKTKLDAKIYGIRHVWGMIFEMHFEKREDVWKPVYGKAISV
ncbi:nuclear transport factor 2 family protein [Paenibacillus sp. JX-17]|uniref:Nuclear transport factor 2 family protein n=1 Tax=Paenibacillus lacisoli TaxID=3064525 RepID=A0ABT9C6C9_9BACL|nr:nuclear transport factor 2 family protein [Paenibacillus sp. JX-17]MDO7904820.1 nuclear transport factor 2 family protein [Paenibacillus sp. JX-17]